MYIFGIRHHYVGMLQPDSSTSRQSSSPRTTSMAPSLTIMSIGLIVGVSFALTKIAALAGISAIAALFWSLALAGIILLGVLAVRGERLNHDWAHLRYYLFAGLLGVTGPNFIAFTVLAHVPAGLFTALVMLSPLATVAVSAVLDRALPDGRRSLGILTGLAGLMLTILVGAEIGDFDARWLIIALAAPLLLACGNIYRNRAYPAGSKPIGLAAGMLVSQAIIWWGLVLATGETYSPIGLSGPEDRALFAIGALSAVSYILTFAVQRRTDGVGFSQVGYFATLSGIACGAILFGETLSWSLAVSLALILLGLGITNGHLRFPGRRAGGNRPGSGMQ